ncbi:molybdate ABC transporter permease subunit [Chitinimonas sp. BJB300]|uniref:molybdate ABC transporter permease subunit n=1 Tax=Chitinimonas sp. BJB300 TaxID=1559339 RepID=UPI000C0CE150|nr:molybdate ABC transporter permease subunit [Chitinimonas sp. BJB300]PHV11123.1 molybdate ABC transporter permease subunit [Chitinimonas sp. BJB300]TSJ90989.1 molybdate ABC transporter permease subunit [Chitinimonas sp. BJB300]
MLLGADDWSAIGLTFKLASLTTALLLLLGTPLAWWLSRSQHWFSKVIGAVVTLPLVLPPTVLGFYLLVALGSQGPLGQLTIALGWGLLPFSFSGLLLASMLYSLPFTIQPLQQAFQAIGNTPLEAAATLRASPLDTFFTVLLPLAKPGLITATVMTFAHTVGEFGVVLMIGGNIPGKTRVISVQLYDHVEALEYTQAHWLAGGMLLFSFTVLLGLQLLQKRGVAR